VKVAGAKKPRKAGQRPETAVKPGAILKVIGGASSGGILVRCGKGTSTEELPERLAHGSVVRAAAVEGDRLEYELLTGEGPAKGWVSLKLSGKPLLVEASSDVPAKNAEDAIRWYSSRLERSQVDGPFGYSRTAFGWTKFGQLGEGNASTQQALRTELEQSDDGDAETAMPDKLKERALDADGEFVRLCCKCRLPLGSQVYAGQKGSSDLMHGECMAQFMLQTMRSSEDTRKQEELDLKKMRREEFDIGWRTDAIPRNSLSAAKLGCADAPQGLCCLALQQDGTVRVAPTFEPAAALSLEYLSLALQVRRTEGREPLFSLDPIKPTKSAAEQDPDCSMQMKRFEPDWLAGTSLGEVMFQADYHLKELSMGEYEQPVVGMKSCVEYSEMQGNDKPWSAREWFVVRQAEIQMSDDNVIIPLLKMGVEAREQCLGPRGLEDVAVTHPDHPLVKYADSFTRNFDLIAERKSVISQLREVAKASIMAKFMMEFGFNLEEPWFKLGGDASAVCCLEVPQLWNERFFSKIRVQDGKIVSGQKEDGKVHGMYGGVDFGIDRFRLAAPSRIATSVVAGRAALARPSSTLMATSQAGLAAAPTRMFSRLTAPLGAQSRLAAPTSLARPATSLMATSRLSVAAPQARVGLAAPLSALGAARPASSLMATSQMPRGVDLNLDKFNLSSAGEAGSWAGSVQAPAEAKHLAISGETFLSNLDSRASAFNDEDRTLLAAVFNPSLSDRRAEGDLFLPPPTNLPYLSKLRTLVKAEVSVTEQRKAHFFSRSFVVDNVGPLFPMSWTDTIELGGERSQAQTQKGMTLQPRPDLLAEESMLQAALESAVPTFRRVAEDGLVYLIYRLGSLEVRATQGHDGKKVIGAVFSTSPLAHSFSANMRRPSPKPDDKIVKVTEYVEKSQKGALACQYYVVFCTESGNMILTEKLADGTVAWKEDPPGLEDRNSLAKVICSAACNNPGITVFSLKCYEANASSLSSKRYAHSFYSRASGEPHEVRRRN